MREQIATALLNMAEARPPLPFARRFSLLSEQCHGGQAVVNFARDAAGGLMQYAIKVFCERRDFDEEVAQYQDPVLRRVLPDLIHASDNADGSAVSANGFAFPPYLVLERGMPLKEWLGRQRRAMEVAVMVEALAELLATLHGALRIHRDVKCALAVLIIFADLRFFARCLTGLTCSNSPAKCNSDVLALLDSNCMNAMRI